MRFEINNGNWAELDGDIVVDSSMAIQDAEAYITEAMKDKAIEQSLMEFVKTISGAWTAHNNCEAEDVNNSIWLGLLKFRDDPKRWNVRYLKSKAVHLAKGALKDPVANLVPYEGEPTEMPAVDWSDLYDLIDSVKNTRQRLILRLRAKGEPLDQICKQLKLSVEQVRSALSKGLAELKKKLYNMPEHRREEFRSLWS